MPAPRLKYVHYATSSGNALCGQVNREDITHRPPLVTCPRCKETKAYKEMMEDEDDDIH